MYFYYFPNKEEVFRLWNLSFEESPIHFTHISKIGRNWRNGFGMIFFCVFLLFLCNNMAFNWNNLKLIYKNALLPNLVKISPVFLEENFFKRCPRVFFINHFATLSHVALFWTNFNRPYSGTSDMKFTFIFQCFERNFTEFLPLFTLGSQCQFW